MVENIIRDGLYYLIPLNPSTKRLFFQTGVYYVESSEELVPALIKRSVSMGGTIGLACFFFSASSGLMVGGDFEPDYYQIQRPMARKNLVHMIEYYRQRASEAKKGNLPEGYIEEDREMVIEYSTKAIRSLDCLLLEYFS